MHNLKNKKERKKDEDSETHSTFWEGKYFLRLAERRSEAMFS